MTQNNSQKTLGELKDGALCGKELPNRLHQEICFSLSRKIADFIDSRNGSDKVYPAPFAVFIDTDSYVDPDISVVCDKTKLSDQGCHGAPDWIIEVTSPATQRMDYFVKLFRYRIAGVREYWIVNPMKQTSRFTFSMIPEILNNFPLMIRFRLEFTRIYISAFMILFEGTAENRTPESTENTFGGPAFCVPCGLCCLLFRFSRNPLLFCSFFGKFCCNQILIGYVFFQHAGILQYILEQ